MKRFTGISFICLLVVLVPLNLLSKELTYGEAAYVIVNHSKLFNSDDFNYYDFNKNKVNTIHNRSAIFLNNIGIDFDPLHVSLKRVFKLNDAPKILGQIYLLHSRDIDFNNKSITLPKNYTDWKEFCDMHSLDPNKFHKTIKQSYVLLRSKNNH